MSGRIGIDFGTSNSVVAVWDPVTEAPLVLDVPDMGAIQKVGGQRATVVPSLVNYGSDAVWLGGQVLERNLYDDRSTFRWMKRYVSQRAAAVPRDTPAGMRSALDAAADFLTGLVEIAMDETGSDATDEVAFSVPVESFEHYEQWLREVTEKVGISRFRLIDEASAAALGYQASIQPGDVYLVFDFGGGTLDVSVVLIEDGQQSTSGRRVRVLGKSGAAVGGSRIDQWLFSEVLRRQGRRDSDDDVRPLSSELLVSCETAKETLSSHSQAEVSAQGPSGRVLSEQVTRDEFEDLLESHGVYSEIDRVVRSALARSGERGYDMEKVKSVLLVGGSSLIPSVQKQVTRMFGKERVQLTRPLEAVAMGVASFVAGVDFFDHIQHDYAVRHVDPRTQDYGYRPIVPAGTQYPTDGPIASVTVKGSYDGQEELGIAVFELASTVSRLDDAGAVELVFDAAGAARVVEVTVDDRRRRSHFWMNEGSPTFLAADPPAKQGDARFRVDFHVDAGKQLLVTAQDLRSGKWLLDRHPVVKLT